MKLTKIELPSGKSLFFEGDKLPLTELLDYLEMYPDTAIIKLYTFTVTAFHGESWFEDGLIVVSNGLLIGRASTNVTSYRAYLLNTTEEPIEVSLPVSLLPSLTQTSYLSNR